MFNYPDNTILRCVERHPTSVVTEGRFYVVRDNAIPDDNGHLLTTSVSEFEVESLTIRTRRSTSGAKSFGFTLSLFG